MSIFQLYRFREENCINQLKREETNISTSLMAGLCHLGQLFWYGNKVFQCQLYMKLLAEWSCTFIRSTTYYLPVEIYDMGRSTFVTCTRKLLVIADMGRNGEDHTSNKKHSIYKFGGILRAFSIFRAD